MFNNGPACRQAGQTLVELVVVVAVSVIIIGALVFATISSLRNASFSRNQAQATKLAQEAIERVRSSRDRNQCINGLTIQSSIINSWNGSNPACSTTNTAAIWEKQINGNCGNTSTTPPSYCFFNVASSGAISYIGPFTPTTEQRLPTGSESIPPFQRAVYIFDASATFSTRKTITAIVTWNDFSGYHESRLTTILGKQ